MSEEEEEEDCKFTERRGGGSEEPGPGLTGASRRCHAGYLYALPWGKRAAIRTPATTWPRVGQSSRNPRPSSWGILLIPNRASLYCSKQSHTTRNVAEICFVQKKTRQPLPLALQRGFLPQSVSPNQRCLRGRRNLSLGCEGDLRLESKQHACRANHCTFWRWARARASGMQARKSCERGTLPPASKSSRARRPRRPASQKRFPTGLTRGESQ